MHRPAMTEHDITGLANKLNGLHVRHNVTVSRLRPLGGHPVQRLLGGVIQRMG